MTAARAARKVSGDSVVLSDTKRRDIEWHERTWLQRDGPRLHYINLSWSLVRQSINRSTNRGCLSCRATSRLMTVNQ